MVALAGGGHQAAEEQGETNMKRAIVGLFAIVALALGISDASAAPVTFTTTGVFSGSGTNTITFTNGALFATLTFNGTMDPVNTPAGASFGDLVITTNVPPDLQGPASGGGFTLNISQVAPAGSGSLPATLSGNIGFNTGVAQLNFTTTSITIGGFTYTVNPTYTLALPATGVGGGAAIGTTTIQGTVMGGPVPDSGATVTFLGVALLALFALQRRFAL
jgi:hypothetical protein